jgi:hypothetical protein
LIFNIPIAIGRSKLGPSLRSLAGANDSAMAETFLAGCVDALIAPPQLASC